MQRETIENREKSCVDYAALASSRENVLGDLAEPFLHRKVARIG